jgi:hypothetical protein
MMKPGFRERFVRAAMALAVGGSAFQLGGCDTEVRQTVLTGLEATAQGVTSTLISAFFLSLQDDSSGDGLTTTS